uniref:RNase H type-1 domain-containing protein n=1 Tax=Chenopodium quinoa TaxID=63459 RepID=A0A803KPI1_CHEQI
MFKQAEDFKLYASVVSWGASYGGEWRGAGGLHSGFGGETACSGRSAVKSMKLAEALAARMGVRLAKRLGFRHIELKCDALKIVKLYGWRPLAEP